MDALIEKVIYASDRADLVAATHALDRVLLWNEYVIPAWGAELYPHGALGPLRPSGAAAHLFLRLPGHLVV